MVILLYAKKNDLVETEKKRNSLRVVIKLFKDRSVRVQYSFKEIFLKENHEEDFPLFFVYIYWINREQC